MVSSHLSFFETEDIQWRYDRERHPIPAERWISGDDFFSKTYDEAQDLVVEAMDHVRDPGEKTRLPPAISMLCSVESLRLTARLTQIMAWLLFQRAVHAGEVSPEQAAEPSNRLGGQEVCNDRKGEHIEALPGGLRDLLLRSRKLYQRIARLDEMIARDTEPLLR
jgi:regulator of CtrA degradation